MCSETLAQSTASRGFDTVRRKWFKFDFKTNANLLKLGDPPKLAEIKTLTQVPAGEGCFTMIFA